MSILSIPKYDLSSAGWTGYKVPFRNTLLQALYPNIRTAILKASTDPNDRDRMIEALIAPDGLCIDFATGAKKRGEFIATNEAVSHRFWETPEQAVAYGSNLLTDCCEEPITTPLHILVVQDGEHETGDCHAKMGLGLGYELGATNRAAQFRLVNDRYLAKGTMITTPVLSPVEGDPALIVYDLIIPLSAFKSAHKPALGVHDWPNPVIAIQGWSERRRVKVSYTVLQWFSRRTIEADVLPHVEKEIEKLLEAGRSVQAAAELLHLDEADPNDPDEQLLSRILAADTNDRLSTHPWIVNSITRMIRRRWLHLALGGGLKAIGLQGLPDDSLPVGVISTPDLPYGPIIAFRYPVRSWADVRLWKNVRRREHKGYQEVVWMSHETAALVGGDFDGDYFNYLPANDYPAMTTEIRRWHHTRTEPPVVKVKERRASNWSALPKVMMDNTDNMVGLITYFIAQASAMGRLDLVDALAPELQIAVDKFKYNLSHDLKKIKAISKQLLPLAWLSDRKDRDAFHNRPIHVDNDATDTISYLARQVGAAWEPPTMRAAPLESFAPLFPKPTSHVDTARELARRYGRQVAAVIRSGDRDGFGPIFSALREWAESRTDPDEWATAVWHAVHRSGRKACPERSRRGTGSLAFHAFTGQVIAQLVTQPTSPAANPVTIVGLPYHAYASSLNTFDGQPQPVTITTTTFRDQVRGLALIAGRALGLVSAETPIPTGLYNLRLTWNGNGVVYAT